MSDPALPASTSAGGAAVPAAGSAAAAPSSPTPGCFSSFVSSFKERLSAALGPKRQGSSSSSSLLKPPTDWKPKKIAAANPASRDIVLSVVPSKKSKGKKDDGDGEKPIVVRISRVGAAVRSLVLPDGTDVVLGSDEALPYLDGSLPYFGVVVGRVANRVAGASFPLPTGETANLPANDNGRHCLHGGVVGWDKREWSVVEDAGEKVKDGERRTAVTLSLFSPDGDQGFPGNVKATVRYSLSAEEGTLRIEFGAVTDGPTAVAMTQHTYFNLDDDEVDGSSPSPSSSSPFSKRNVLGHKLQIDASRYLPKSAETGVPDGRLEVVDSLPFLDFRKPKKIGGERDVDGRSDAEAGRGAFEGDRRGYDDCYEIDDYEPGRVRRAAVLTSGTNGDRSVEVWTDARGLQFYSAGFCGSPSAVRGKGGERHGPFAGAALETHAFPNGVNVDDWKRDMILMPGEEYRHVVEWRFSW